MARLVTAVMQDYDALLDRARSLLPEAAPSMERFTVPTAEVMYDGKNTVLRNLKEVADQLRREPDQILNYLAKELGCPGVMDGPRGVLKSKLNAEQINLRLREYTNKFVICSECKRPDTHLDKSGRVVMLICEACGAQRPVHVRRAMEVEKPKTPVVAGETYRLTIEDLGKRGDGLARKEGFVIFITGANQKGTTVNAKVTKVLGNTAYAILVP